MPVVHGAAPPAAPRVVASWLSSSSSPEPWTAASRPSPCRWTTTTAPVVAVGLIFTKLDRAGSDVLSSRLGLSTGAHRGRRRPRLLGGRRRAGHARARASTTSSATRPSSTPPTQVEQLARLVDEMGVDVFAFGITADFRTQLFPGQQAADRAGRPGAGAPGRGAVLVRPPGHPQRARRRRRAWSSRASRSSSATRSPATTGVVEYEVLCRRHYMRRMTSHAARAAAVSPDVLPFDLDVCPLPPLPITQAD